ncbi:uncharacterized protein [Montipora capricornis]|uniref:uncharacterized protein n=1 Tax=Montipora capricornis TaxID=246305 RepID=UPI0035F1ED32
MKGWIFFFVAGALLLLVNISLTSALPRHKQERIHDSYATEDNSSKEETSPALKQHTSTDNDTRTQDPTPEAAEKATTAQTPTKRRNHTVTEEPTSEIKPTPTKKAKPTVTTVRRKPAAKENDTATLKPVQPAKIAKVAATQKPTTKEMLAKATATQKRETKEKLATHKHKTTTKPSATKKPKADIIEKSRRKINYVFHLLRPFKEFLIAGAVVLFVLSMISCCCFCICRRIRRRRKYRVGGEGEQMYVAPQYSEMPVYEDLNPDNDLGPLPPVPTAGAPPPPPPPPPPPYGSGKSAGQVAK